MTILCTACRGSGEGQFDGELCRICHGTGDDYEELNRQEIADQKAEDAYDAAKSE